MGVAKRILFVGKGELEKLLGLPDDVEILAVNSTNNPIDGWEFLLISPEEVKIDGEKITVFLDNANGFYRKITLDTLKQNKDKVDLSKVATEDLLRELSERSAKDKSLLVRYPAYNVSVQSFKYSNAIEINETFQAGEYYVVIYIPPLKEKLKNKLYFDSSIDKRK